MKLSFKILRILILKGLEFPKVQILVTFALILVALLAFPISSPISAMGQGAFSLLAALLRPSIGGLLAPY